MSSRGHDWSPSIGGAHVVLVLAMGPVLGLALLRMRLEIGEPHGVSWHTALQVRGL